MASGITVDMSGMDDFMEKMKEAAKPQEVGFDVLLNDGFLQKHTRFQKLADFEAALDAAGITDVNDLDDLDTD